MAAPGMQGAHAHERSAAAKRRRWPATTPANAALVLGSVAILCTLLWAMHEDAQHDLRREAMAQQARAQQPPPSAEQRRHMAAQFVCGHGVAYQWVNANTVECLRELDPQVAIGR